ncbi:MAG TPA: S8 family serine peptidase [Pyrinomonadaceae bacterium]|nr:S8 family serine peptidase [Pyrinomonadaceae bacterium]
MSNEAADKLMKTATHEHDHAQNRFGVIPTPVRLDSDPARTGRGVTIAFLDSGFYPHPDLTEPFNRIIAYQDIAGEETSLAAHPSPRSWHWHGTQTSVVAAGNGRLSGGIYRGLASDAQVVLVKVSAEGEITEENIARGIEWVIENQERYQIRVLNISLGGDEDVACSQNIVDLAAEEAVRRGIVVVAAAGNSGCTEKHTSVPPANSPSVITVGGYDDKNQLGGRNYDLYCSNYGQTADGFVKPEIIAPAMWVATPILPGTADYQRAESLSRLVHAPDYLLHSLFDDLWQEVGLPASLRHERPEVIRSSVESLLRQHKIVATHYQHGDGTSFAAPVVSSVVAQMMEANPRLTPASVRSILISAADRIIHAPVIRQGYGVLNARHAVELASCEKHLLERAGFGPPRVEDGRLVFLFHDDAAERVALAGDFNGWDGSRTLFVKEESGIWRTEIDPPAAGRYRYKFIINGGRWVDDPHNGFKEPDEYGGLNSVLSLT